MTRTWRSSLAIALLVTVVLAAYANSFQGRFVFDDLPAIVENPTLQRGAGFASLLQPPPLTTVAGRPVLNLTLALNQRLFGHDVWSYHAINLLIHLAAGVCLAGLLRRTFRRCGLAAEAAWVIAALWLLHPLQTESVTYLVQRAESLMGLFYLAAAYSFVRALEAARPGGWKAMTVLLALAGMATKESMVTLPCFLLLYDRTFCAGNFAAAVRARPWFYAALAGTWVLLAVLMAGTHSRGGSAGFAASAGKIDYAVMQLYAVVHYLRLAVFPTPLIFDYGSELMTFGPVVALHAVVYFALLAGTVIALRVRPVMGFLGATFFLLLAPTSTVVPVASQAMAEHRMYLALAVPLIVGVMAAQAWLGRRALMLGCMAALAFGLSTAARNTVYHDERGLWQDTATKRPGNGRAHDWLGGAALETGQPREALAEFRRAVAVQPGNAKFRNNLGAALATQGDYEAARAEFQAALGLDPAFRDARHNLGQAEAQIAVALIRAGRVEESIPHLRRAAELEPEDANAAANLALAIKESAQSKGR